MSETTFDGFVAWASDVFEVEDGTSLRRAYSLYKVYCARNESEITIPMYKFRDELGRYFEDFHDRITVDGFEIRSYFAKFKAKTPEVMMQRE